MKKLGEALLVPRKLLREISDFADPRKFFFSFWSQVKERKNVAEQCCNYYSIFDIFGDISRWMSKTKGFTSSPAHSSLSESCSANDPLLSSSFACSWTSTPCRSGIGTDQDYKTSLLPMEIKLVQKMELKASFYFHQSTQPASKLEINRQRHVKYTHKHDFTNWNCVYNGRLVYLLKLLDYLVDFCFWQFLNSLAFNEVFWQNRISCWVDYYYWYNFFPNEYC